jgi:glutathione S-transferase
LWLLEELGEPFEVRHIDLRDPESRVDPDFRAASPMGKVPAISDGKINVADSSAIALYLADRYPGARLAPSIHSELRGRYLYWMTFTPGVIEPAMAERFNGWEVNRHTSGWGDFDLMLETLESGLRGGPWILGERFTAADTLLGSSVYFMKIFGILPDSPLLAAYADRCLQRSAYQKALGRESV